MEVSYFWNEKLHWQVESVVSFLEGKLKFVLDIFTILETFFGNKIYA